jgi:N-acyl homoserine lactone hydrolase
MIEKLWILDTGRVLLDQSILTGGLGFGQKVEAPVWCALAQTSEGYVMIDTGLHPEAIADPDGVWGARAKVVVPTMKPENDVRELLKRIGAAPDEIRYVVTTHMHWDHTGANKFINKATYVVQKSEYAFAYYPETRIGASYMKNHFDFDHTYKLIEGDFELAPGILLLYTPGHTPGHQSALLRMADGREFLIAGDAVYTAENLEKNLPPGNCWSNRDSMLSLDKIRTIGKLRGAEIWPAHDLALLDRLREFVV